MRNRDLAPAAVVGAIVCCGTTALITGAVGGVALATIGRFTAVSVAGLGIVVFMAWRLDRRRRRLGRTAPDTDRAARAEETPL